MWRQGCDRRLESVSQENLRHRLIWERNFERYEKERNKYIRGGGCQGQEGGRTGRCLAGRVLLWEDEVFGGWKAVMVVRIAERAGEARGLSGLCPLM